MQGSGFGLFVIISGFIIELQWCNSKKNTKVYLLFSLTFFELAEKNFIH